MSRPLLAALGLQLGLHLVVFCQPARAETVAAATLARRPPTRVAADVRFELSQVGGTDTATDRNTFFTQLRTTLAVAGDDAKFHLDGRARRGWADRYESRTDITRLCLQYGLSGRFKLTLGRQVLEEAAAARVDGIVAELALSDRLRVRAFGGPMPHPLDGAPNADFLTFGLGYRAQEQGYQHLGAMVLNTYGAAVDRIYFTDRLLWQLHPHWTLFGFAVVDLNSPKGTLGGLREPQQQKVQSGIKSLNITSAQLSVRLKPSATWDAKLRASHHHTVLPSVWWRDWLTQERVRRGFIVDEHDILGTRRSSLQLTTNLHFGSALSPYAAVRLDKRNNDQRDGRGARAGVKVRFRAAGYADAYYSYRRYFTADNHVAAFRLGLEPNDSLQLEVGGAALHSTRLEAEASHWLFDINGSLWYHLGAWSAKLSSLSLLVGYQTFIDPGVIFHLAHVRLIYRSRS